MHQSAGCYKKREISQDSVGQEIHKGTSEELSHGVNYLAGYSILDAGYSIPPLADPPFANVRMLTSRAGIQKN